MHVNGPVAGGGAGDVMLSNGQIARPSDGALTNLQMRMRRSLSAVALSRELLDQPVYPWPADTLKGGENAPPGAVAKPIPNSKRV
jgi:hypothetical protein